MEAKNKSMIKRIGLVSMIVLLILASSTYAIISMYFTDHFYHNTIINGTDYSFKIPLEVEDDFHEMLKNYSLEIIGRDGVYDTILPVEIDMDYEPDATLGQILKEQPGALWILGYFKEYRYDVPVPVQYDEAQLQQKINGSKFLETENIKEPHEAYLFYSEDQKEYVVELGSSGTEINPSKMAEVVKSALKEWKLSVDLNKEGCYLYEEQLQDNQKLQEAAAEANQYIAATITYQWNGNEVIVDADTIKDWVILNENKAVLDEEAIKSFISEQSKLYDTYGKDRTFHTTDGREVVLKSGGYGWKTDRDAEYKALTELLHKGGESQREPEYLYKANHQGLEDIGSSYVEIDLGKQHLYLYIEGQIVLESDFVSGNVSRGWTTPPGVFGLTYKTRNAVLRGETYETPVSYWMPFNGNIGMHDAGWRSSFGGDIYLNGGSHGCVNMPPENAKAIYEYLYTGFPVVCYY